MNTRFEHTAATLLACCAVLLLAACDYKGHNAGNGGGGSTPQVTTITVTLASSSIAVGGTETSTAVAKDQNGAVMSGVAFTWASSNSSVATVSDGVASGVAAGTTNITALSGGVTSNAATLTVTATVGQNFQVLPARLKLTVDDPGRLLAMHPPGAVTWSTSNAAVVTVDELGQVQALAKGSAVITATSGSSSVSSTVTVYQTTGANPDPSSEALIAAALAQNTISSEQALTYRVFAFFGDERLPVDFDGALSTVPDHLLIREVSGRLPTLSQATQELLLPFLVPPVYQESWLAQQQTKPTAAPQSAGRVGRADATLNCVLSQVLKPSRTTAHFNIYPSFQDYLLVGDDGNPTTETITDFIASVIEEIYTSETVLFTRIPLSDAEESCNGGDGKVDIYVFPLFGNRAKAVTHAYPNRCEEVPAYIVINENEIVPSLTHASGVPPAMNRKEWKSYLAHEFLHVLQFGMNRQAGCDDYKWFDEATAQWVMDHVEPDANFEDGGRGRGSSPVYRRANRFFQNYLYNDHRVSIENASPESDPELNGYGDYLFFQFLARTYTSDIIADIFNATEGEDSIAAIASVLDKKDGMKAVWPAFAKTLWNDDVNHVLDDWSRWDKYDFGLAAIYSPTEKSQTDASDKLKTLDVDQKGQSSATFDLLQNANDHPGPDYLIEPRSIFYEHLKFTDATVHYLSIYNPIAGSPDNEFMKVQALKKIGGTWQAPENWTNAGFKTFCLDKKDERLEELLIIVSNSEANRNVELPFRISKDTPMRVSTSNVGCWRWEGATAFSTQRIDGPVMQGTASVAFNRFRFPGQNPEDLVGLDVFKSSSGLDAGAVIWGIEGTFTATGCTISGSAFEPMHGDGALLADGGIIVNFQPPSPDPLLSLNHLVIGSGSTQIPAVTKTITCPGNSPETLTSDEDVAWLSLPDEGVPVSADGQHIDGRWERTDEEGTKISVWNFQAVREP